MRRGIMVTLVGLIVVMSTACSSDKKDVSQCKLVSAADVAEAIGGTTADGRVFEHEKSGDGTWCLYEMSVGRIETHFEQGAASEFDSQKERCLRNNGAESKDLSTESEQLVYCRDGIPGTFALTGGIMVRVQALDLGASRSTVAIARTAIQRCCPSD